MLKVHFVAGTRAGRVVWDQSTWDNSVFGD